MYIWSPNRSLTNAGLVNVNEVGRVLVSILYDYDVWSWRLKNNDVEAELFKGQHTQRHEIYINENN